MASNLTSMLPNWTKRVVMKGTGRDPLGLSRVSDKITDHLLPAITTQTSRARYYSFYPWCFWHINETEDPKTGADHRSAFHRREAAFAISSVLSGSENTIVGVEQANRYLYQARDAKEVDTSFQVLPSNADGGFGQYYGGSIATKLGLVGVDENGRYYTGEGRGTALAEAFQSAVDKCPYIAKERYLGAMVPVGDLDKSSTTFSLDAIS